MWVETIDGVSINTDTLEKIEVAPQNSVKVSPKDKVITIEKVTEDMTPEEKEKRAEEFKKIQESLGLSEDKYEIRAWSVQGNEEPYILFRGTKNDCEAALTKLK